MHSELISKALNNRFMELRVRTSQIAPETFGDMLPFVAQLRERIIDASPEDVKPPPFAEVNQANWFEGDADCLTSIRQLSLGEQLNLRSAKSHTKESFIQELDLAKSEPERRFQLLIERYQCPVNSIVPSEVKVREYLLARLMVQDRTRIERDSIEAINGDDLLLRLNLISLQAAIAPDLRFLDALNYYYELMPATWRPQARHNWLAMTYFALYARALSAWI